MSIVRSVADLPKTMDELLTVDRTAWRAEADGIAEFFAKFGDRLPAEMRRQHAELAKRLG